MLGEGRRNLDAILEEVGTKPDADASFLAEADHRWRHPYGLVLVEDEFEPQQGFFEHGYTGILGKVVEFADAAANMFDKDACVVMSEDIAAVEGAETLEVEHLDEVRDGRGCPSLEIQLFAIGVESQEVLLTAAAGDLITEEPSGGQPLDELPVGHAEARLQFLPVHVPARNF